MAGKKVKGSLSWRVAAPVLIGVRAISRRGQVLRRALFHGRVAPPQTIAVDEDHAARNTSVVDGGGGVATALRKQGGSEDSPVVRRPDERLQPLHPGVCEPIEIAHRSGLLAEPGSRHPPQINGPRRKQVSPARRATASARPGNCWGRSHPASHQCTCTGAPRHRDICTKGVIARDWVPKRFLPCPGWGSDGNGVPWAEDGTPHLSDH